MEVHRSERRRDVSLARMDVLDEDEWVLLYKHSGIHEDVQRDSM